MGSFSMVHWLLLLFVVLILFGAGKIPRVMGDFAKGIKAFKAGMKEEDEEAPSGEKPRVVNAQNATPGGVHVAGEARPGERG